jgi:drug/metabolite transporter (DMT)-like permease
MAWILVLVLGGISTYAHLLVVWAFQKAPASVLVSFQYLEIASAALLGYVVFAEFSSPSKLLGIAIIIAFGLFIFWRERRVR